MTKQSRETVWILCPKCGNKSRTKVFPDTVLVRFPLFCSKCKKQYCISLIGLKMQIVEDHDKEGPAIF